MQILGHLGLDGAKTGVRVFRPNKHDMKLFFSWEGWSTPIIWNMSNECISIPDDQMCLGMVYTRCFSCHKNPLLLQIYYIKQLFLVWWLIEKKYICTISWCAQSPDSHPIGNIWHDMKQKIQDQKPANKTKLVKVIATDLGCCDSQANNIQLLGCGKHVRTQLLASSGFKFI